MSVRLSFDTRAGRESMVVGSRELASRLALTRKNAKIEDINGSVDGAAVEIIKCAAPEIVKEQRSRELSVTIAERVAEAQLEAGSQARLMGESTSDALDSARLAGSQVALVSHDVCGQCGRRRVSNGFTMCRPCSRRY